MKTLSTRMNCIAVCTSLALTALLAACSGSGTDSGTVTVQGDVAIAYAKRSTAMRMNPTNGAPFAPGGDLIIREKSSPSAAEHNVTAKFTLNVGDVSDPEPSYDGKKIVFTMRCPADNAATIAVNGADVPACTGRWNVWEYDMTTGGFANGTFRRLTSSTQDDDVDPAYLPGGRGFVFASNRQTKTKTVVGGQTVYAVDEYERERVLNLHTMDNDGGAITQISANQSHDRNPVVTPTGEIMFSRWEHVGPRNRFAVFTVKPDGTNMFVRYGAHSPGNSFLHPRDMDPAGKYNGFIASDLMSLSGTQEGGALMFIDAKNYSEQNTPANKTIAAAGGQSEVTAEPINQGRGLSENGRLTAPFPLWDGTNRVLLAFRPCQVTRDGVVIPCSKLTAAEKLRLGDEMRTKAEEAADPVQDNAPAAYSIYMFDPTPQTWLLVAAPPAGFMYTDPIALQARTEPNTPELPSGDADLAALNLATLEVRSIYDTDGLGRMSEGVLAAVDLPAGCAQGIKMTAPSDTLDTRSAVADLVRIKDPADPAYLCAPARFVRAVRAVAPQMGMTGMREAIGETDFEPQQILGYAPIEPDGSFKLHVPADTPLALTIVDAKGRNLQTHLNWIQVRPGERRTCDGCHSPRRGAALNSGAVADATPAALLLPGSKAANETLASLKTRSDLSGNSLRLQPDMVFTDTWADTSQAGVVAKAPIMIKYAGNTNAADDLVTAAPANGMINYPVNIQPLWTRDRGANTCTNCHADSVKLDLRGTTGGTGRVVSYEELVLGDPVIDEATGLPVTRIEDGEAMIVRGAALVETDAGNANGLARSSRLAEILFGESLKASAEARTTHPNPPNTAPDHAAMLNLAEKRLVTEWMDLGGQYYNDLAASGIVQASRLSQTVFESDVYPILQSDCATCHQPVGTSGAATPTAGSFKKNRFVLAGSPDGDYNVTLTMVSDSCNAPSNALLMRPSTIPHPSGTTGQATAVLPVGSAKYNTIASWISGGCP